MTYDNISPTPAPLGDFDQPTDAERRASLIASRDDALDTIDALRAALGEALAKLSGYAGWAEMNADEMQCNASNFDGGSPWTCEHCQYREAANTTNKLVERLSLLIA